MRPNRPLLIISIVLTVFFLAAAILIAIKGQAYPMPTGNEITSYFVVARCKHELKFYILMCGDECVSAYPIEEYTSGA